MTEPSVFSNPTTLAKLKEFVSTFRSATFPNAEKARKDRSYYDHDQISNEVRAELIRRGQPPIFNNLIQPALGGVLGLIDSTQCDPEAMARDDSSAEFADVVTKTLRYVADKGRFKRVRANASKYWLIEGVCAALIRFEDDKLKMDAINWEDFIYDPESQDHDFWDARFLGFSKFMDADEIESHPVLGPEYEKCGSPFGEGTDFDWLNAGSERNKWWIDKNRKRVRIVDLYFQNASGVWNRAIFCSTGILYQGESPYHDDEGATICPIVGTTYEIDQEGNRYGAARAMIHLQDEVNSRRSKLLQLVNMRQTQQTEMMTDSAQIEIVRREAAKPDGVIPFGYSVVQTSDMSMGQANLLSESKDDLNRLAPTPAMLGRTEGASESGRARQMLRDAGSTEQRRYFNRFQDWEERCYRLMWFIAREHITTPMAVRVTGDNKAPTFFKVNQPIMGPRLMPAIHPATGEPIIDPLTAMPHLIPTIGPVGIQNHLALMDVDIVLTLVPDTVTLQQETFQTLMEYASSNRLTPFDPMFWAMIEMSTLPNKAEIIAKLQRLKAEADQMNAPAQQAQQQEQQAQTQSELALTAAKAAKDNAHAQQATASAQKTVYEMMHPGIFQPRQH